MAKFSFDIGTWVEEDILRFAQAESKAIPISKAALYEGAKIVADEVHNAASKHGTLANGLDLSTMETSSDGAETTLRFGGYDAKGTPYPLIANVLESGSSKQPAKPFFRPAVNKARNKAKRAMHDAFWSRMNNILNKK